MPYIEKRIKRYFCTVFAADASLLTSSLPSCSVSIAPSQNSDTTHSFANSSNLSCNSIVPGLDNFEQVSSDLSNFRQVSALTFGAIGGVA